MARALYPATHLTPQQIQMMSEAAERCALIECAKSTKKKVYLKAGRGGDSSYAGVDGQLVGSPGESELIYRALLPDTDLNAGGVAYDQWLTQALVAGNELQFVNQVIRVDQVVVIYGIATLSALPAIGRVRLLNGTAVVLAAWDATPIWSAMDTVGYADEFAMWPSQQTVSVFVLPFLGVAGGERFILIGGIAEPKGSGPVTK